jgi:hypothetical protein
VRAALLILVGCAILAGCKEEAPTQSCPELRQAYDHAFRQAVEEGAAKRFKEQKRYMSAGQDAYLQMEKQGCCKAQGACPSLNLR